MTKILPAGEIQKRGKARKLSPLTVPSENEILDICRSGEDQTHEFKAPGIEMDKMSKEIAAFSNTRNGGLIFYGVDDDGTVIGSDKRRQVFDQSLQNSIRNTISPQPNIDIKEKDVLRHKIIVVVVQPWDRKNIYQYRKEQRYYIRRGTNMFAVTPDELKKLGNGEYVV
jgi:predicted HTH transcriptional regulator